ncbi:MAG: hypothetical protein AAGJ35_00635, partial [Myxococcota bacterium]
MTLDAQGHAHKIAQYAEQQGFTATVQPIADCLRMPLEQIDTCILVAPFAEEVDAFEGLALAQAFGRAHQGQKIFAETSDNEYGQSACAARSSSMHAPNTAFLSITCMDGQFGQTGQYSIPTQGALAGLVKTAALEWEDVHCRALDIHPRKTLEDTHDLQQLWTLMFTQGPVEIAVDQQAQNFLLEECDLSAHAQGAQFSSHRDLPIRDGEVLLVTGGARGVTFDVVRTLCTAA